MIRIPHLEISLILIPKTGTTSIKDYILKNCPGSIEHKRTHISKHEAIEDKFASPEDRFIAVVRDPIELQLSRYFYKCRQGMVERNSPEDFRQRIKQGKGLLTGGEYYETAPQYWFVDRTDWLVPFTRLESFYSSFIEVCGYLEVHPFKKLNKSNLIHTSLLLPYYYDAETKELAEHYHKQDIELYKKAKGYKF